MQKKLLITVSDDVSHLHGVRFVGSFFKNKSEVIATLFYVAPRADVAGGGKAFEELELDGEAGENGRKKGWKALETAQQMLVDHGFPLENITCKFTYRKFGTVKDILSEAKAGAYDAVVLGRRGYTLFESVLPMSVTRGLLDRGDRGIDFPIWICRRPEENRKNVLLCLDGSDASLRMVEHVCFMLTREDEHSITLLHVDVGEGADVEAIFKEPKKRFLEKWGSDGRIETLVATAPITGVAEAILKHTADRAYAVVAVGRMGVEKGRLKEWLVGSRTMKLLETIEKATLWVSS